MKRWISLLAALALLAAACGGDDDGADTTTQPTPTTTTTVAATTTTEAAPTTTAAPPTTAAPAGGSTADLAITEVVFGDHFTLTNLGDASVDMDGLWVCNRPAYAPLTGVIGPGESLELSFSEISLPEGGGEVALYSSNSFGDSSALLDYVSWGSGGGRATEAADAGLWPAGETVAATGPSISAPSGGSSPADWS